MAGNQIPTETHGELIQVVQLPIITEQLRSKKEEWDCRVKEAMSLVCTEDTIQAVKKERADLGKEFAWLEAQRKAVKSAIMKPYEDFEAVYKECVSDAYKAADTAMKEKISDVETEQKRRCEEGLRAYFEELREVHHLDWLTYEQAGIKVDMASAKAKTPSKLRKQLAEFVVRVNDGVNLINSMDGAEEIMVEFRRTLDAAQAIGTVRERHRRVEEERAAREVRNAARTAQAEAESKVIQAWEAYLQPPVEVVREPEKDPDEIIPKLTFTVYNAPRWVLRKIRDFLRKAGIRYE